MDKFVCSEASLVTRNPPVCEPSSNSRLMVLTPVFRPVVLPPPDQLHKRQRQKQRPSLGEERWLKAKGTHYQILPRVVMSKELVPQILYPAKLNLGGWGWERTHHACFQETLSAEIQQALVVRILTFCCCLSEVPACDSYSSLRTTSVHTMK